MVRERSSGFRERSTVGVRERSGMAIRERNVREREVFSRHGRREAVVRHSSPKFARFHRVTRAPRRFHVGIYHRPHGWFRHHWRLGERLPRAWFGRSYWITDWGLYGLWAPYDGLVWVRVGPDAFLIDPYTGEVVSIEYGIFW
jgi:Ni/Co efflux regulator RcnB